VSEFSLERVQDWLVDKVACRIEVDSKEIDVNQYFDEFGLDSTEALVLAGELEKWLGMEIETTALWYHPTIADLSQYLVEEQQKHATLG
jgi:acyl carrier protein